MDLRPIGTVRCAKADQSVLELKPSYAQGLDGLEEGDKIQVLYWMHELRHQDRRVLRVHPRGNEAAPKRGVFAVRSPMRPNPIGVSVAEVLGIDHSCLVVQALDARDGSPIIDIKLCHG